MTVGKAERKSHGAHTGSYNNVLGHSVRMAMENYFADLDGHDACNLYDLFIAQVEKPMLEVVLQQTRGNMTRASQMLGLNRATLRTRLKKYGLD
jgi:Fis family transcriptional regulator